MEACLRACYLTKITFHKTKKLVDFSRELRLQDRFFHSRISDSWSVCQATCQNFELNTR